MFVVISLVILSLSYPQLTVNPSSIATVSSFQFNQVNGVGLEVRYNRFSVGYYKATLTTRDPGELIGIGNGWVRQEEVDLLEVNSIILEGRILDIGIGLNRIEDGEIGWQVFVERTFSGIVTARVGFRRLEMGKRIDSISATFSVDIIEAVKSYRNGGNTFAKNGVR